MSAALLAASRDFFSPRMLGLVLWPLLGSLLLWLLLFYFLWSPLVHGLQHLATVPALAGVFGQALLDWFSRFAVFIALLLILPMLVQLTALLITSAIAMPVMVRQVTQRHYPQLERRQGGSAAGSVWNTLAATLLYLLLWLLTLPLWLFGLPALLLPLLLGGWLNDRLFCYDALADHAGREEYRALRRRAGGSFFLLGMLAAAMQMVPLLNLVSPVFSGLSFIHFGCAELEKLRNAKGQVLSAK